MSGDTVTPKVLPKETVKYTPCPEKNGTLQNVTELLNLNKNHIKNYRRTVSDVFPLITFGCSVAYHFLRKSLASSLLPAAQMMPGRFGLRCSRGSMGWMSDLSISVRAFLGLYCSVSCESELTTSVRVSDG